MTPVRRRIVRVKAAALAVACAAALALPLGAALVQDESGPWSEPVRGPGRSPAHGPPRGHVRQVGGPAPVASALEPPVALDPTALQRLECLRAKGDVRGLLGLARARAAGTPAAARLRALAVASLAALPGDEAGAALRALASADGRDAELDRLVALGALWERGERAFVLDVARRSADPAVRAKAQALAARR